MTIPGNRLKKRELWVILPHCDRFGTRAGRQLSPGTSDTELGADRPSNHERDLKWIVVF